MIEYVSDTHVLSDYLKKENLAGTGSAHSGTPVQWPSPPCSEPTVELSECHSHSAFFCAEVNIPPKLQPPP